MWRKRIYDVSILDSLVEDLQLFWQLKATRWEQVERRIHQRRASIRPEPGKTQISVTAELRNILENDPDYSDLKNRIIDELQEGLEITKFMGYEMPPAMLTLAFEVPLPDNSLLEEAVKEAQEQAMHARYAPYTWRNLIQLARGA